MSYPVCENCTKGYRLPGTPSGDMVTVGGFKSYFRQASNSSETKPCKKAIILFTDIFGLTIPNTQLIGDSLGEALDMDVYVPDMFDGKPPLRQEDLIPYTPDQPGITLTIKEKIGWGLTMLKSLPGVAANRPNVFRKHAETFIRELKSEKKYEKIGVVGYCLGGCGALHVATTDLVDAVVICHPGPTSTGEVSRIRTPTSWACAEEDVWLSNANREQYFKILSSKKDTQAFEYHVYAGTTHGFAARPNLEIPQVKQAYEDALQQATKWFWDRL